MNELQTRYETWYRVYHAQIQDWIAVCSVDVTADMVLKLADMLKLSIDLSQDAALSDEQQTALHQIADKVMRGVAFLPVDSWLAVLGLQKDVLSLATVLEPILDTVDAEVVAAYWLNQKATARDTVYYLLHEPSKLKVYC